MSNDHHADDANAVAWTILRIIQWTADYLKRNGVDNPRPDAEILLAHTLECQRIDLYLNHDQPLQAGELEKFKPLIRRRAQHEPVAYIVGLKEFWSLSFKVTPDVLIPRPETEELVAAALASSGENHNLNVLDLGTGSGIIGISLAHERPDWNVMATDISLAAVEVARSNALNLLGADRVKFWVGNWFDALGQDRQRFDLIVSNPPYVSGPDLKVLEPDIARYEPSQALDGGPDGLDSVGHIINEAHRFLDCAGWLLIEIGYDQGAAVKALGSECGAYQIVTVDKDYSGHDRIARLQKK